VPPSQSYVKSTAHRQTKNPTSLCLLGTRVTATLQVVRESRDGHADLQAFCQNLTESDCLHHAITKSGKSGISVQIFGAPVKKPSITCQEVRNQHFLC